jgi:hypothetical protein
MNQMILWRCRMALPVTHHHLAFVQQRAIQCRVHLWGNQRRLQTQAAWQQADPLRPLRQARVAGIEDVRSCAELGHQIFQRGLPPQHMQIALYQMKGQCSLRFEERHVKLFSVGLP